MLNSSSINSGILSDIELLLKAVFETHEHHVEKFANSTLRLITIEKMISLFEEYDKYISARYQEIFDSALKLSSSGILD